MPHERSEGHDHFLTRDTALYERALAEFCRTDKYKEIPGVRSDRVTTYRALVFGTVEAALRSAYPVTAALLGEESWLKLSHDFFSSYECSSPLLWRMPYGLVCFVGEQGYGEQISRPYLRDLLLFEWVEIEVHMMPDTPKISIRSEGNVMRDELVLNLEHKLIQLSYPVFRQDVVATTVQPGCYWLLCYRHPERSTVHYIELTAEYHLLFQDLVEGVSVKEAINHMKFAFALDDTSGLVKGVREFLEVLFKERVILGFSAEL